MYSVTRSRHRDPERDKNPDTTRQQAIELASQNAALLCLASLVVGLSRPAGHLLYPCGCADQERLYRLMYSSDSIRNRDETLLADRMAA